MTRNAGRLFPRSLGADVAATVAEVQRRHAELCADNARKKAGAVRRGPPCRWRCCGCGCHSVPPLPPQDVELALRRAFFGQLDREHVEPLVGRCVGRWEGGRGDTLRAARGAVRRDHGVAAASGACASPPFIYTRMHAV